MPKSSILSIFGLTLSFSSQLGCVLPINSQPASNLQINSQLNSTCQTQKALLLNASKGLLYPSESDYLFEYFDNYKASSLPSPQQFLRLIGQSKLTANRVNFDEFFHQLIRSMRLSGTDPATIQRYEFLRQAFKTNFTALTVYRVGQVQVQVYITGINSTCGMVGLKTISIET